MTAIHLKTPASTGDWSEATVQTALSRVRGVVRVAVIASIGLVSVLFDEKRANPEQIRRAVTNAGLDARLCR